MFSQQPGTSWSFTEHTGTGSVLAYPVATTGMWPPSHSSATSPFLGWGVSGVTHVHHHYHAHTCLVTQLSLAGCPSRHAVFFVFWLFNLTTSAGLSLHLSLSTGEPIKTRKNTSAIVICEQTPAHVTSSEKRRCLWEVTTGGRDSGYRGLHLPTLQKSNVSSTLFLAVLTECSWKVWLCMFTQSALNLLKPKEGTCGDVYTFCPLKTLLRCNQLR